MVAAARAAHGPIDIVIANAGAAESAPAAKIRLEHWQRMIDVNLTGAFLTVQAALADVTRKGEGTRPHCLHRLDRGAEGLSLCRGLLSPPSTALSASTRALSGELRPTGVTVNAVCPGFTDTPLLDAAAAEIAAKTGRSSTRRAPRSPRTMPHGRLISPEDVAAKVLWLCSPAAHAVNGEAIVIAGGAA